MKKKIVENRVKYVWIINNKFLFDLLSGQHSTFIDQKIDILFQLRLMTKNNSFYPFDKKMIKL